MCSELEWRGKWAAARITTVSLGGIPEAAKDGGTNVTEIVRPHKDTSRRECVARLSCPASEFQCPVGPGNGSNRRHGAGSIRCSIARSTSDGDTNGYRARAHRDY